MGFFDFFSKGKEEIKAEADISNYTFEDESDIEEGDEAEIIVLFDEKGKAVNFVLLDIIDFKNRSYVVLLEEAEIENGEVLILEYVEDESGEAQYLPVENEKNLKKIFELFRKRNEGKIAFEI